MKVLSSTDEAHRSHSIPIFLQALGGRLPHLGMIGEAEIVIRTEVDDLAVGDTDLRALRTEDVSLCLQQAGRPDVSKACSTAFLKEEYAMMGN